LPSLIVTPPSSVDKYLSSVLDLARPWMVTWNHCMMLLLDLLKSLHDAAPCSLQRPPMLICLMASLPTVNWQHKNASGELHSILDAGSKLSSLPPSLCVLVQSGNNLPMQVCKPLSCS
jgi:hypothetical protein